MASGPDRVPPRHQHQPIADGAQPGKPPPQKKFKFPTPLQSGSVEGNWATFGGEQPTPAKPANPSAVVQSAQVNKDSSDLNAGWPVGFSEGEQPQSVDGNGTRNVVDPPAIQLGNKSEQDSFQGAAISHASAYDSKIFPTVKDNASRSEEPKEETGWEWIEKVIDTPDIQQGNESERISWVLAQRQESEVFSTVSQGEKQRVAQQNPEEEPMIPNQQAWFTRTKSFEDEDLFERAILSQTYGIAEGDLNKYLDFRFVTFYQDYDLNAGMSGGEQRDFISEDSVREYIISQSHLLGISPRQIEFDDEYREFRSPDSENDRYYRDNIDRYVPSAVVEPIIVTALGRYSAATGDSNSNPGSLLFQNVYNRYLARLVREFDLLKDLPIYVRHILKISGYELHDLNPELYLRFLNVGNRLRRLPPLRVRFMKPLENRDARTLRELEKKVEEIEKSVAPAEINQTQGGSLYDIFPGDSPGTNSHCPPGEYPVPINSGYDDPSSIPDHNYLSSTDCSDPLPYLSFLLDVLPIVGDVKGVIEAFTGKDLITGDPLPIWQRILGALPLVGDISRVGGKITVELTGRFVRRTVDDRVVVEFVDQFGRVVDGWQSKIDSVMAGIERMLQQIKSDWDWFTGNVGVTEAGIQIRIPDEAGDAGRVQQIQGSVDSPGRPSAGSVPTVIELVREAPGQPRYVAVIDFGHIIDGEIRPIVNQAGELIGKRAVGGHYVRSPNVRITEIIDGADVNGVMRARIQVRDPDTGAWITKQAPSTFYPDHWTRRRIQEEITEAFYNSSPIGNGLWEGISPSGMRIQGYYRIPDGNAATAWPVYSN